MVAIVSQGYLCLGEEVRMKSSIKLENLICCYSGGTSESEGKNNKHEQSLIPPGESERESEIRAGLVCCYYD